MGPGRFLKPWKYGTCYHDRYRSYTCPNPQNVLHQEWIRMQRKTWGDDYLSMEVHTWLKKKKNPCIILFNVLIMGTQVMCEMVGTWKICPFLSTLLKWFREALWIYWQGRNGTPIRWDRAIPQHWQLPGAVATAKPEGARWGPVPAHRERESLVGDWPGRRVPFLTVLMSSVSLREGRKHPSLLFPLPSSLVDLHWPKSAWVLRDSGKIETLRVGSGRTNKRRGTRFLTGSLLQKWDHHLCSPATSSFISPTRPNSDFLL